MFHIVLLRYSLCWPVLYPQMIGEAVSPGDAAWNWSWTQSPTLGPLKTVVSATVVPSKGPASSNVLGIENIAYTNSFYIYLTYHKIQSEPTNSLGTFANPVWARWSSRTPSCNIAQVSAVFTGHITTIQSDFKMITGQDKTCDFGRKNPILHKQQTP